MEIVVCVKAICRTPAKITLKGDKIDPGNPNVVIDEIDDYAVEEALALKKSIGGTVTAVSVGGLTAQNALCVAKAKGADRIVRVDSNANDPVALAEVLAATVRKLGADLVMAGTESYDNMSGQMGICLAEKLGLPFAYSVISVQATAGNNTIRVKKELGGGIYQVMDIKLPAVLCIQSGIQPLTYIPIAKLMNARRETPECIYPTDLVLSSNVLNKEGRPKILSVFKPETTRKAEILKGEPAKVAAELIQKIYEVR